MGGAGDHPLGTLLAQQLGPFGNRAAGIDHVVDDDGGLARHITDHRQAFSDVVGRTTLVDDGQRCIIHALGEGPGARDAAHIW